MKTINNLNIDPERELNDKELINLKGGQKQYACKCSGSQSTWYTSGTWTEVRQMIVDKCTGSGGSCEAFYI